MNYLDANQLLERRKHRSTAHAVDRAEFRTPPNKGVSTLAKIIAGYLRRGKYARFAVLSGMLSAIMCV
jgi:hypothetical protein